MSKISLSAVRRSTSVITVALLLAATGAGLADAAPQPSTNPSAPSNDNGAISAAQSSAMQ